jgi:hypothetical protein
MIENNYKQAARLIAAAEAASKLPVRVTWDDSLQVGAVLHLSEADWAKQLRISVNPNRRDIPYLVGSQCAVAIRFFRQKDNKHLVSKKGSLEATADEFIELGYSPREAKIYTEHLVPGIGQQLRGMPIQILISTWLYREYPELHESQLNHCTIEVESAYPSLEMDANKYPSWLLKSHQAMNGAFALATDYLFESNDLFVPFKNKGFEAICTGLVGDITASTPDTIDSQLVSLWIDRLNLSDRFEWQTI